MSVATITEEIFEAARSGDRNAIARLLAWAQPDIRRYARATAEPWRMPRTRPRRRCGSWS